MASVVPSLRFPLRQAFRQIFGAEPLFVEPGDEDRNADPLRLPAGSRRGPDRQRGRGHARLGGPCIVVDFGTATTFDVVTAKGEYAGGVIVPGISISAEALFEKAARLWRVEIRRPDRVIGKTTAASIQSGLYFGYLSLVDGVIERIDSGDRRQAPGASRPVDWRSCSGEAPSGSRRSTRC